MKRLRGPSLALYNTIANMLTPSLFASQAPAPSPMQLSRVCCSHQRDGVPNADLLTGWPWS